MFIEKLTHQICYSFIQEGEANELSEFQIPFCIRGEDNIRKMANRIYIAFLLNNKEKEYSIFIDNLFLKFEGYFFKNNDIYFDGIYFNLSIFFKKLSLLNKFSEQKDYKRFIDIDSLKTYHSTLNQKQFEKKIKKVIHCYKRINCKDFKYAYMFLKKEQQLANNILKFSKLLKKDIQREINLYTQY